MRTIHIIKGKDVNQTDFNHIENVLNRNNLKDFFSFNFNNIISHEDEMELQWISTEQEERNGILTHEEKQKKIIKIKNNHGERFNHSHEVFFNVIDNWRLRNNINQSDFIILLTTIQNESYWLSASDDEKNNCYINIDGWNEIIQNSDYPEVTFFYELCIVNSIFQNIFQILSRISYKNAYKNLHKDRGCISDFTKDKSNYIQSLTSGRICPQCQMLFIKHNKNQWGLFHAFEDIFSKISNNFWFTPKGIIQDIENLTLAINDEGVFIIDSSSNDIEKEEQILIERTSIDLIIIYLFILKHYKDGFNILALKDKQKIDDGKYWKYINESYKFCKKLYCYYNPTESINSDKVNKKFRTYFYNLKNDTIEWDDDDNPQIDNLKDKRLDITPLSNARNRIENKIIKNLSSLHNDFKKFIPVNVNNIWKIEIDLKNIKFYKKNYHLINNNKNNNHLTKDDLKKYYGKLNDEDKKKYKVIWLEEQSGYSNTKFDIYSTNEYLPLKYIWEQWNGVENIFEDKMNKIRTDRIDNNYKIKKIKNIYSKKLK
jgi:hypothetical protein